MIVLLRRSVPIRDILPCRSLLKGPNWSRASSDWGRRQTSFLFAHRHGAFPLPARVPDKLSKSCLRCTLALHACKRMIDFKARAVCVSQQCLKLQNPASGCSAGNVLCGIPSFACICSSKNQTCKSCSHWFVHIWNAELMLRFVVCHMVFCLSWANFTQVGRLHSECVCLLPRLLKHEYRQNVPISVDMLCAYGAACLKYEIQAFQSICQNKSIPQE